MTIDCPICRRPFQSPDIMVDRNSNTVIAAGKVVKLYPRESQILDVLVRAYPLPVSRDDLATAVIGQADLKMRNNPRACIAVHVNRLQRKLTAAQLPFNIVNEFGQGFRIHGGILGEPPEIIKSMVCNAVT